MIHLEVLFLMQCLLGILMLIFLQKISQLKKQVDTIIKEVKEYVKFIEEDSEREIPLKKEDKVVKLSKDEAENHLIQAVLKEYLS